MRPSREIWAMELAKLTAQRSTCCRRQVGCVLLNEKGHVLSTGYNGIASGLPHCNEENPDLVETFSPIEFEDRYPYACLGAKSSSGTNLDGCQAIHAEQNAMLQCGDVHQIHTCFVTTSPCMTCTKLLLNTSCKKIIFVEEYSHNKARILWESAGRKWLKFEQS